MKVTHFYNNWAEEEEYEDTPEHFIQMFREAILSIDERVEKANESGYYDAVIGDGYYDVYINNKGNFANIDFTYVDYKGRDVDTGTDWDIKFSSDKERLKFVKLLRKMLNTLELGGMIEVINTCPESKTEECYRIYLVK